LHFVRGGDGEDGSVVLGTLGMDGEGDFRGICPVLCVELWKKEVKGI